MNTQLANQNDPQQNLELRIRTIRILWLGMFLSIGAYYVFTMLVGRPEDLEPNDTMLLALVIIGMSTTLVSIFIKNKLLTRAIEQKQVQLVQQAYIVAWALAEVAALLGVLAFFVNGSRYYYLLFIIAACGLLLHFPRREHVLSVWPKSPII